MLTNLLIRVADATPEERAEALDTIVDAFAADPAVLALYPDPADYRAHFPTFMALFAGPAQADVAAEGLGAALWLGPGVAPDPAPLMAHIEATTPAADRDALLAGLEAQGALHPHAPHWYLPFIGVRPEAHSMGVGSALLAHGLARADRDRLPAYLEATSRRSVPLYCRFGFQVTGVVEQPGYPEIFAMWRPARAAA